eukprot:2486248-Amphidinium_carterae.1
MLAQVCPARKPTLACFHHRYLFGGSRCLTFKNASRSPASHKKLNDLWLCLPAQLKKLSHTGFKPCCEPFNDDPLL